MPADAAADARESYACIRSHMSVCARAIPGSVLKQPVTSVKALMTYDMRDCCVHACRGCWAWVLL